MSRKKEFTYKTVFEAVHLFETLSNTLNREWLQARRFVDWQNLHELSDREVMRKVVKFLNQWSSHIKKTPEVVTGIKEAYRVTLPALQLLQPETLWDLNLKKEVYLEDKALQVRDVLYHIFKRFRDIGYHLREVASSKLLHHINPNLFIMWDNKIMKAYGVKGTPRDYVIDFLPLMKDKANQVIESYSEEHDLTRNDAIDILNSYRPDKTLVKLLDEYNWITYTYFGKR